MRKELCLKVVEARMVSDGMMAVVMVLGGMC